MTTTTTEVELTLEALAALDALGPVDGAVEQDSAPTARRRRSGSSRAERKAKAAAGDAPKAPRAPRAPRKSAPKLADGMANLYTLAGFAVAAIPSAAAVGPSGGAWTNEAGEIQPGATVTQVIGVSLTANAGSIGAAWEQAAKDDPRIREALERLLVVSTFGAIVAAHAPVMLAGAIAGGLVPDALAGAVDAL